MNHLEGEPRPTKAFEAGEGTPSHDWEHFREVERVIARRHILCDARQKKLKFDIADAESILQKWEEEADERASVASLSPKEREVLYIHRTIFHLEACEGGSQLMDVSSYLTDEELETMRPYDPEFIGEILSARPNHPLAHAREERVQQRFRQVLPEGKQPTLPAFGPELADEVLGPAPKVPLAPAKLAKDKQAKAAVAWAFYRALGAEVDSDEAVALLAPPENVIYRSRRGVRGGSDGSGVAPHRRRG
jgi:hypothetical protein